MSSSPWKQSTGQTATQSVKRQRLQLSVTTKVMAPWFYFWRAGLSRGGRGRADAQAQRSLLEGGRVSGAGAQHLGSISREIDHGGGHGPARPGVNHQAQTGKLLLELARVRARQLAV